MYYVHVLLITLRSYKAISLSLILAYSNSQSYWQIYIYLTLLLSDLIVITFFLIELTKIV